MDRIILPQDNSNENSNFTHNNTIVDEMSMDQQARNRRRDTASSIGFTDNNETSNNNRKRKKDDKIPFTPEVSIHVSCR